MNEFDILEIISSKLSSTEFLGNDCAKIYDYVASLPLIVTQDTLVEDVHFSLNTTNPFELAVKSITVNVSDLRASLALPKYISISLSLPQNISKAFVEKFYEGIEAACKMYKCCVCGGDLTRSDKIVISICAIGQQIRRIEAGRQYAEEGDLVLLFGSAGDSALGLLELAENSSANTAFTKAHLSPEIDLDAVYKFSELPITKFCAMDTSDGLADAIYKISMASKCVLDVDVSNIPLTEDFKNVCKKFNRNIFETILFGAEDFSLLVTMNAEYARILNIPDFHIIGRVVESSENPISVVRFGEQSYLIDEKLIKSATYKHFSD